MIKILYEDNHLLVVEKPINIPVQADDSKDKDLLSMLKEYIKEKYKKPGNVYLGLVHRLDRPVGGVMVFAKTSKAASRLSEQVRNHSLKKEYHKYYSKEFDSFSDYLKIRHKLFKKEICYFKKHNCYYTNLNDVNEYNVQFLTEDEFFLNLFNDFFGESFNEN